MLRAEFIFNGGLGNQIFQYFASEYISKNSRTIDVSYSIGDCIIEGARNFELNEILIKPLKLNKRKKISNRNFSNKLIKNFPFLSSNKKSQINFQVNLLKNLYEEKLYPSSFIDPLLLLSKNLSNTKKNKLKISGYWQNPSCYINELEDYINYFTDTKKFLPKDVEPNKYITIHVRREDYFLDKGTSDFYFSKFSPIKFIILSLQLLPQEYQDFPIYLLSDDVIWRNKIISILSNIRNNKFTFINTNNHFQDWSILRHASLNICSNSTFSYTAALLNKENKNQKLRCIVPQWINSYQTAFEKGWLKPEGFLEI